MSNKWQNRNEIGGILRKGTSLSTNPEAKTVDLLVFGYACKIFRDDEKAREIDHGKHLIPWMGDANLKIDRYDVRGALYDLTPYEPPPGGYGNRLDYLSSDEQRAEQLCEEERYYYLYRNEQEEIMYQEEELKRLQQENERGTSYNQVQFSYDAPAGPNPLRDDNSTELEPENEADKDFCLPKNFVVPSSIQLPETMRQHAIIEKTARFISTQGPQMEILIKAKQSNNQQFDFLTQNNPLNSYYKFVLNALKNGTYPIQEVEGNDFNSNDNDASSSNSNLNNNEDPFSKPYVPVPTIKYTPSANCAYTQLISKIKGVPLPPPEPEKHEQSNYTPVLLQQSDQQANENGEKAKVDYRNAASNPLKLAHYYSSDTENEEDHSEDEQDKAQPQEDSLLMASDLCFPIPPEYLQNIIDKTASYVIKNGRQFEETLRSKSDERFTFLFPSNEYYSYYMYRVTGEVKFYTPEDVAKEEEIQKIASGPVSFSIKTKDDQPVSVIRPALPQETSDDENDTKVNSNGVHTADSVQLVHQQPARSVPEHVQKAIQLVESQLMARNAQLGITTVSNRTRFDIDQTGTVASKSSTALVTQTVAEEGQLKTVNTHQKELKRAEEKVKDKLAQIAREKLGGLLSKEKQLQIERKRKAMAFLNQIKGTSQTVNLGSATTKSTTEPKSPEDSDTSSVHSIPITSYGDDKSDTEFDNKRKRDVCEDEDDAKMNNLMHSGSVSPPKRPCSKARTFQRSQSPKDMIVRAKKLRRSRSRSSESRIKRSKSKSRKSKKKTTKHSHHSKRKSKKRSRSRTRSAHRSRSRYSDDDDVHQLSSDSSRKEEKKRSSSHKKKRKRTKDDR